MGETMTCVREDIPVTAVVFNNGQWGAEKKNQVDFYNHRFVAGELESESWPTRLVSCLAACERYFEQRVRLGEREAQNAELAQAQWAPLTAAADVLEALAFLPAPDGQGLP